jgi:hypothetical protein
MNSVIYCYTHHLIQLLLVRQVAACAHHLIQAVFRMLLNHLLLARMKLCPILK